MAHPLFKVAPDKVARADWNKAATLTITPQMFGGIADCTAIGVGTDNAAALNAAIASAQATGGEVFIPRGRYRVASRISVYEGVTIRGEGHFENPGLVAGVNTGYLGSMDGSILIFDDNVAGMILYAHTDLATAAAYDAATDADKFKYKSAQRAVLKDFMLWGGGENGTSTTAHGLEIRTVVRVNNVRVSHFAGTGCLIQAAGHTESIPYGIADGAMFVNLTCRANGMHGLRVRGNDANVITFIGGDFAINGGACVLDESQLGNTYVSCHTATGNQTHDAAGVTGFTKTGAAYVAKRDQIVADNARLATVAEGAFMTTSIIGAHTFVGCYSEGSPSSPGSLSFFEVLTSIIGGNVVSGSVTTNPGGGAIAADSTGMMLGFGRIENLNSVRSVNEGPFKVEASTLRHKPAAGTAVLEVDSPGTYATVKMFGAGVLANGLEIYAGAGQTYYASGDHIFRNAAQTVTFGSFEFNGVNVPTGKGYRVNSQQVVGERLTALPADATDLATALTLVNAIKARLKTTGGHGLVAD